MSHNLKSKIYSVSTSAYLRAIFVLVVIAATALAAGAPYAWGTGG